MIDHTEALTYDMGFVTENKFLDVQINIKRWQEVVKLTNGPDQLQKMLAKLIGVSSKLIAA